MDTTSADETDGIKLSTKMKLFLERRMNDLEIDIKKLKRKRKIIKILYYTSITLSVIISAILATIVGFVTLPVYIIPILSTTSAVLTALSIRFNLQNKQQEINVMINKLSKLQKTLDYIVSCNGNLTQEMFNKIISKFT